MANDDDVKEEIENEEKNSYEEDTSNENPVTNVAKNLVSAKTFRLKLIIIIFAIVFFLILFLVFDEDELEASPNNNNCSKIDFSKTVLTKDQFVTSVNSYLNSKGTETAKRFIDNAGNIYDWGLEVGANPEMVYIIAQKEQGFNDGSRFALDCNNFYGFGVTNGQSTGKCFTNFEDGVRTILKYVKEKGSLDDFVKVYSYLGTYLANPGSWGDGGCIYLKLPEIYGPNYNRCNNSYKCPSSRGGPGCVLTTKTEKQAYIDYQASIILKHRKSIFNISSDDCDLSENKDVSTDGTVFLNEPISSFLPKEGTTYEEYNDKVLAAGCKGRGTGEGAASVAYTAIAELAKYGKKFHYTYGGAHANFPREYGVPASWGPPGTGPDCSGFVSWAIYNAGFNLNVLGASGWGATGARVGVSDSRVKVGDLIVTPSNGKDGKTFSHVVIITAIHSKEGYVTVAEANSTAVGLKFSKIEYNKVGSRQAVLMDNYYNNTSKSKEFEELCKKKGY